MAIQTLSKPGHALGSLIATEAARASVDLYWLPLGAGGWFVRLNGRIYEAIKARLAGRRSLDLYHSALEVRVPEGRFIIEVAPVPDGGGASRGVVMDGPVGSRRSALPSVPLRGPSVARWGISRTLRKRPRVRSA